MCAKRGQKGGSGVRWSGKIIHNNPRCHCAFLAILSNFGADDSLGFHQIEQATVRPSLQNALEGHTISRRSAAAGCADAQATPQSSREALRRRLRVSNGPGSATQRRSTRRSTRWQLQRQRQQHSSSSSSRRSSSRSSSPAADCSMPIGRRELAEPPSTLTVFLLERAIFNAKISSPAARL